MPITSEDKDELLKQAAPKLLEKIVLSGVIRMKLFKADVITPALQSELKVATHSDHVNNEKLINHLTSGTVLRFLKFCKVMYEDGETQVTDALKVNMDDVYEQLGGIRPVGPASSKTSLSGDAGGAHAQQPQPVFPIWDGRNKAGQELVVEDKELMQHLCEAESLLKGVVRMPGMWSHLRKYGVKFDEEDFTLNATKPQQLVRFFQFLKEGEVWMVHAFCKALVDNNQGRLIIKIFPDANEEEVIERYTLPN